MKKKKRVIQVSIQFYEEVAREIREFYEKVKREVGVEIYFRHYLRALFFKGLEDFKREKENEKERREG